MPHQTTPGSTRTAARGKLPLLPETRPETRPEFMAAIRLQNGKRDIYRIRNARDVQDARQVVLDQLDDVASVVVMPCAMFRPHQQMRGN